MMKTLGIVGCTAAAGALLSVIFDAKQVGDYLLLVSLFASINFTFWYMSRSRWRILNAGRSLAYVFLAIDFVLLQNALSIFVGTEYFGRAVFRVFMYLSIAVAIISMTITLWRIQKRDPTITPQPMPRFIDEVDLSKQRDSL